MSPILPSAAIGVCLLSASLVRADVLPPAPPPATQSPSTPVYSSVVVPQPLTEADAVRWGLQHNPQIGAGLAGVAAARADYKSLDSLSPITLGLTATNGSSTAPSFSGENRDEFFDVGTTLDLSRQRHLQAAAARSQFDVTDFQFEETRLGLNQQLRDAYWSLVAARAQADFATKSLADVTTVHALTEKQLAAGASPQIDVLRSSIDLANAQQDSITAQGAERAALAALNLLLARPPAAPLELADSFTEDTSSAPPLPTLPPLDVLIQKAVASRALVRGAAAQVRSDQYSVAQARASRRPDLTVDYERSFREPVAAVVVGANFPLFDFGSITQSIKSAVHTQQGAEAALDQARQQVAGQVESAYRDYTQAQTQTSTYATDILAPSGTLLGLAQKGYAQGGTGILPVLDAESTLRNARTGYLNNLLALYKARDEVDAAVGAEPLR